MSGVNKVILVGRLGKDPESRTFDNGTQVANFSLATSDSYKDKITGERKETTEWHNIVCFRKLAEIVTQHCHKGDLVYIDGKIKTRSWDKDGVTRYTTEVIADTVNILSRGNGSTGTTTPTAAPQAQETTTDDLPF
jgi:single-strand DNA-binding protein